MSAGPDPAGAGLVVVDIDGVVADVRHRVHHLDQHPKDWAAFFAEMDADPLLSEGSVLVHRLAADHPLCWLTGRPRRYASVTASWLRRTGLPEAPVWHRPDGDRRPASALKTRLVRRLAQEWAIELVVDDDEQVCSAVAGAGFRVLHATWAATDPRLHEAQERDGRT